MYGQLPNLDFDLLGDATKRRADLLGDYKEQKLRLCKLFALRRVIRHSHKTKSKLEQERLRRRAIEKREGSKDRARKRKQALQILNDEHVEINYLVKGDTVIDDIKRDLKQEKQISRPDSDNKIESLS